jgi:hypothetical protein
VPAASVLGIVNLLPYIFEQELFDIEPADRRYVAAESTAFLLFLLTRMPCRVVNRPTAECLNGPCWRPEQWSKACSSVGIRTKTVHRNSTSSAMVHSESAVLRSVTFLGGKFLGKSSSLQQGAIHQLARLANVSFLKINYIVEDGWQVFHSVEVTPDLSDEAVRIALHEYFSAS